MAKAKQSQDETVSTTNAETDVPVFTKEQILSSKKFSNHKDILMVILKDDRVYTIDELEKEIKNFNEMKVEV